MRKDRTAAERQRRHRARRNGQTVTGVTQAVTVKRRKAPKNQHLSDAVTVAAVTPNVTPRVTVDLVTLRRDIKAWVEAHRNVERAKVRERRYHFSWQVCRFTFLGIAVTFFVLLAYAAVS